MFIDRDNALNNFKQVFSTESNAWMILSGCKNVGKTSFAKKITADFKAARYCSKEIAEKYAVSFVKAILLKNNLRNIIKQYSQVNNSALEITQHIGCQYFGELTDLQVSIVIDHLIADDLNSSAYRFLNFISQKLSEIEIIFLDDFHLCEYSSYMWITKLYQALRHKMFFISICDFGTAWTSEEVFKIFNNFHLLIDIEKFDSEDAFYDILQQHLMFENAITLKTLAVNIYNHFDGKSKMLFDMIDLINIEQCFNDTDKYKQIMNALKIVLNGKFDNIPKSHWLILNALAYSPCPLSKDNLINICDINEPILSELILDLYNKRLISQTVDKSVETQYIINGEFLVNIIVENCSEQEKLLIKTKIINEAIKNHIDLSLEQKFTLSIDLGESDALNYLMELLALPASELDEDKKAFFINKYISATQDYPEELITIEIGQLCYTYGYYDTAEKILNTLISQTDCPTYGSLLLLGDVQHVHLDKNASHTYESASKVQGISDSMKLQAINRQIMAFNQEHKEQLAKSMYSQTLIKYSSVHCLGLVELYRNTNNSFGYHESLLFTTQGYCLAKKLGEELEMYKCLHNICMLRLLYGDYDEKCDIVSLDKEPKFDVVYNYLLTKPAYKHELAYPLVDLGTVEMFRYVDTHDKSNLVKAKHYFSDAQLYAKSFYAQYIAETGLLIVNSYLYKNNVNWIEKLRLKLYNKYNGIKNSIADYHVHRKILLTLTVSAIIINDKLAAKQYLEIAQPYIAGAETLRYNRLCDKLGCSEFKKAEEPLNGKSEIYCGSEEFVPWLISFCH